MLWSIGMWKKSKNVKWIMWKSPGHPHGFIWMWISTDCGGGGWCSPFIYNTLPLQSRESVEGRLASKICNFISFWLNFFSSKMVVLACAKTVLALKRAHYVYSFSGQNWVGFPSLLATSCNLLAMESTRFFSLIGTHWICNCILHGSCSTLRFFLCVWLSFC